MPQNQQGFIDESFSNGEHDEAFYNCDGKNCTPGTYMKFYDGRQCMAGQTCCFDDSNPLFNPHHSGADAPFYFCCDTRHYNYLWDIMGKKARKSTAVDPYAA